MKIGDGQRHCGACGDKENAIAKKLQKQGTWNNATACPPEHFGDPAFFLHERREKSCKKNLN